jgi:hypothetical protein
MHAQIASPATGDTEKLNARLDRYAERARAVT